MGLGSTNKRKGSNAERYYAKIFRDLDYPFCKTSRQGSKLHDNAKIDLIFIPYNIQIKAGKQQSINVGKELLSLEKAVKLSFPPSDVVHSQPNILIHFKEVGIGHKRLPENELVYLSSAQFMTFKEYNKDLVYDNIKTFKIKEETEYNEIVSMTFDYFKKEIVLKKIIVKNVNNNTPE
ncbi:MAG: hypothetical protein ACRC0V_08515 [Fusobacteriaceae bacterium]